jgi:hypothetical protein
MGKIPGKSISSVLIFKFRCITMLWEKTRNTRSTAALFGPGKGGEHRGASLGKEILPGVRECIYTMKV